MRYAKTLGLMLLAAFTVSAVMASAAPAAEAELLSASLISTKDFGTATFESTGGGIAVKCGESKGTMSVTSNSAGSFSDSLKNCTAAGFKCTGPGLETGTIKAQGAWELVAVSFPELHAVEVFTLGAPLEFTCLGVKTIVLGAVVGRLNNHDKEKTSTVETLLVGAAGKNEITEVNGTPHHLESKTGSGAYVEASQSRDETGIISEVEVMY